MPYYSDYYHDIARMYSVEAAHQIQPVDYHPPASSFTPQHTDKGYKIRAPTGRPRLPWDGANDYTSSS